jgi:hypothetical protein
MVSVVVYMVGRAEAKIKCALVKNKKLETVFKKKKKLKEKGVSRKMGHNSKTC